jgi:hypothetical protein
LGWDDNFVKIGGERREAFNIADDEQLIGCELEYDSLFFRGVTWLKWKIPK